MPKTKGKNVHYKECGKTDLLMILVQSGKSFPPGQYYNSFQFFKKMLITVDPEIPSLEISPMRILACMTLAYIYKNVWQNSNFIVKSQKWLKLVH